MIRRSSDIIEEKYRRPSKGADYKRPSKDSKYKRPAKSSSSSKSKKAKKHTKKREKRKSILYKFKKNTNKRFRRLVYKLLCILLISLGVISYSSGVVNPLLGVRGLILMSSGESKIYKLDDIPLRYICNSYVDFVAELESEGYKVVNTVDRIFELRGNGSIITMKSRDFLGMYEFFMEVDSKRYLR